MGMANEAESKLIKEYQALTEYERKHGEDVAHLRGVLEADTAALQEIVNGITEMGFKSVGEVEKRIAVLDAEIRKQLDEALAIAGLS